MEEELVTLAIHTFEKAQILKTILEAEGVEVSIHNVNLIQPVISAGVRVRIKKSDLPHALRIIEDVRWLNDSDEEKEVQEVRKKILIPVDFSDYSIKACEIGINYANLIDAEVMLLHAYFNAYMPSSFPYVAYEMGAGTTDNDESFKEIVRKVEADIGNLCAHIDRKMKEGTLPDIKYEYTLREGLPEEEIISFAKDYRPTLIVMGTHGKKQKNRDLLGSVTGEIIELTKAPLLAIPEEIPFDDLKYAKQVAFATSFNQHDLIAFDKFVELVGNYKDATIQLFNISTSKNEWNEIRLTGFNEYLKKNYPDLKIEYTVISDGDLLEAVEKFVTDKHIDVIALSAHRRSMITRLFNPSIACKMLFHSNTPLLVIPV
ncbi:MAG: universal stress protein [Tannerella sp.]|jgi:nucleotide-binding universal stress UspA family protein|nr:universal stress protein [Tannerella sp.]